LGWEFRWGQTENKNKVMTYITGGKRLGAYNRPFCKRLADRTTERKEKGGGRLQYLGNPGKNLNTKCNWRCSEVKKGKEEQTQGIKCRRKGRREGVSRRQGELYQENGSVVGYARNDIGCYSEANTSGKS